MTFLIEGRGCNSISRSSRRLLSPAFLTFLFTTTLVAASTPAAAQVTSLTPIATYDAGENIVSYYRYLALDCPNESSCAFHAPVATPSRPSHTNVAALITGFKFWTPVPDKFIGPMAVRVSGTRAAVGSVALSLSALWSSPANKTFSYFVDVVIVESTVEGFGLKYVGAACTTGSCPITMVAPAAVPSGYQFLGFGLAEFDSDRKTSPFWGALNAALTTAINPTTGDVTASLFCGTVRKAGGSSSDLSGPCETRWVAISARRNNTIGGAPSGLLLVPAIAPMSGLESWGNTANPSSFSPTLFCSPHPRPSRGYLEALAGFRLLARKSSGGAYVPATGPVYGLEVSESGFAFPATSPSVTYSTGLPLVQTTTIFGIPIFAPLEYFRLGTMVCL